MIEFSETQMAAIKEIAKDDKMVKQHVIWWLKQKDGKDCCPITNSIYRADLKECEMLCRKIWPNPTIGCPYNHALPARAALLEIVRIWAERGHWNTWDKFYNNPGLGKCNLSELDDLDNKCYLCEYQKIKHGIQGTCKDCPCIPLCLTSYKPWLDSQSLEQRKKIAKLFRDVIPEPEDTIVADLKLNFNVDGSVSSYSMPPLKENIKLNEKTSCNPSKRDVFVKLAREFVKMLKDETYRW